MASMMASVGERRVNPASNTPLKVEIYKFHSITL